MSNDEETTTVQVPALRPDGTTLGLWSLTLRPEGDGRFGGARGVTHFALPWLPGVAYPPANGWTPVLAQTDLALVQALAPLVAHLAAKAMPAFRVDEATGVKALMAEATVLNALIDEALANAGPIARQMVAAREAAEPG